MNSRNVLQCYSIERSKMSESFAQLFEESVKKTQMHPGALITGVVVDIGNAGVVVNAGLKSEAIVPLEQFYNDKGAIEVNVGDEILFALEAIADGYGETQLSREKAKRLESWKRLEDAYEAKQTIIGYISGKVKGGFTVEIGPIRAFLPGSLLDVRPVRDTSYLEGKNVELKVIKMDQKRNNVVVSRRAVMEAESSAEREALLGRLQEGQTVKGIVKNLTDYGAFVDLGGIDGLLHITDMSWKRVKHPSELIAVGQELTVRVLKFDRERNRVSLGLKQLGDDPWAEIPLRYPPKSRLVGKITNITDYGCFVQIEQGVEGLVHVSEMDWTNKNVNPSKVVQLGQDVEVMVLEIDVERRRISLGMKQCVANPWEAFAETHNKDDKISGVIKSITDFGIFIGLDGGIDGLVHLSDISWAASGEESVRDYKKGQEVEAVILAIDPERERISLGIKQLAQDPFGNFVGTHEKGHIVKGTVVEVEAKSAIIDLGDGVLGQLRANEIAPTKIEDAREHLQVGKEIEALILNIDKKNRVINLSIKAKEVKEGEEALQNYSRSSEAVGTTLGDIFKEQLENKE